MGGSEYDMGDIDIAWCPGCGDFSILGSLKAALEELDIAPGELVMVSGIGQAAKLPHYLRGNVFNGLHGRALPPATAIKAVNPDLVVIAESGDGDMYGEGGNHFIHTIRRNPGIVNIVHDNMVYGLTKGQASPTSRRGFKTPVQVDGVILEPFNPIAVAVSLDAPFVARAFAGDMDRTKDLIKEAIVHPGYALLDILQPCVSFNKVNTFKWYRENTYYLDDDHDPTDRIRAIEKAFETERLPLGIIYRNDNRIPFEEQIAVHSKGPVPLWRRKRDRKAELKDTLEGLR